MFQSTAVEKAEVVANCEHFGKLNFGQALPLAFTGHGAIQTANVLNPGQAVEMGVYMARAVVRLGEMIVSNTEMTSRLAEPE
jgi:hypothetical protein